MRRHVLPSVTLLLWLWIFLVLAPTLQAQTPAQKLQQLSQVLNLSPAQQEQLLPILQAEAPKIEAIKSNPSMTEGQKLAQMRAIHQQSDPQVKAILSPQQYETWQNIRQQEIQKKMAQ